MKIAVVGSGGVGGYIGARLADAGADVAFIARGAHLAAMRERGLRAEGPLGSYRVEKPNATDDPATVGPVDLVIVAVKLWDTRDAAQSAKPLCGPNTTVLSLQNGIEKEAILGEVFGAEHVLGGVSYIAATIAEPGTIVQTGTMLRVVAGELDGSSSARLAGIAHVFADSGVPFDASGDIRRVIWEKYIFLVALSGLTGLVRAPVGTLRANERTRGLIESAMQEVAAVARAEGVAIAPEFVAGRMAFVDTLAPETTSSMHGDLERGSRLELPWFSQTVARLGAAHNIPTPVNAFIGAALDPYVPGRPVAAAT